MSLKLADPASGKRRKKKRGKFVHGDLFVSSLFFLLHLNGERKMPFHPDRNQIFKTFFSVLVGPAVNVQISQKYDFQGLEMAQKLIPNF